MALEVRVYDEVTDVDPKVMWGLTFRQLIAVVVMVAVSALVAWQVVSVGSVEDAPAAIAATCFPVVLWAWTRPAGLRLERWLPHVLRAMFSSPKLLYVDDKMWAHQLGKRRRPYVTRAVRKENRQGEAGR